MKICFYHSYSLSLGGGAENWIVQVSSRLAKRHEVHIAGPAHADNKRLEFEKLLPSTSGIEYDELSFVKLPRGFPIPHPRHIGRLLDLINSCDATYFVAPRPPTEVLLSILRPNIRCTLIAGFHGSLRSDVLMQRAYVPLFKKALAAFRAFHALDLETCHWLEHLGFEHVFYVPNGVDKEIFKLREEIPDSVFKVLYVGRLREDKGADTLAYVIRCFNELYNSDEIKFVIAGSGPLEDRIRELAQEHRNVEYLGFVPHEMLPSLYASAHLFFLPSKSDILPLALLEAQSCGLPAVCSKIHGMVDIINNRRKGRLIDPADMKGFTDAIEAYYDLWRRSPQEYFALTRQISEETAKNYNWDIAIDRIETMLKKCLEAEDA